MARLLFDENLSPRLATRLVEVFPGSTHVSDLGMRGCSDREIWDRAAHDGLVIVTKDEDFRQLCFLRGAPPKVIWLVVGNAGTERIAKHLARQRSVIEVFERDPIEALLVLRSVPR